MLDGLPITIVDLVVVGSILLFAVLMIQIFGRTPMFRGPVWTEEAARWIWVWMAFIAIAAVERNDAQLRMGFLADALPARARHWLAIAVAAILGLTALVGTCPAYGLLGVRTCRVS